MENSSISVSSMSHSRGVSVENTRGSSQSSDEGVPVLTERGYHSTSPRGDRSDTCFLFIFSEVFKACLLHSHKLAK